MCGKIFLNLLTRCCLSSFTSLPYIITPSPSLSPLIILCINLCFLFVSPSSHLPTSSELLQEQASIRRREHLVREAIVGKSPGVYSQLIKRFIISSTHFTALQMLNFKWALLAGPNWFNWRTRPNCVLMVCFCLLFDLEDEVAGAQII